MTTKIIHIDEKNAKTPDELEKLREAAAILAEGGLVVFPTETVYGLGANALDFSAVKKIYEVKGRPPDNPLIVHVADPKEIDKYAELTKSAEEIIQKFLPGPLTLVLKKKGNALDASCKLDTIAIRSPKNKTAQKLIELAGVPIAAPSANLSGKPSHTEPAYIIKDLDGKVDMIICGENCEIGLESTVISFNPDDSLNILRSGYITKEMLSDYTIREAGPESGEALRSPGMKYTHYSPNAPLYILSSGSDAKIIDFVKMQGKKAGFLCFDEFLGYFKERENIISIGPKHDLAAQAKNLFCALNRFNALGVELIYSIEPQRAGIGEAIYNRLIRAAGGKVIKLN